MATIEERIEAKQEKVSTLAEEFFEKNSEIFELCSELSDYEGSDDIDELLEIPELLERLQNALLSISEKEVEKENEKFFSKIRKLQEQIEELENR